MNCPRHGYNLFTYGSANQLFSFRNVRTNEQATEKRPYRDMVIEVRYTHTHTPNIHSGHRDPSWSGRVGGHGPTLAHSTLDKTVYSPHLNSMEISVYNNTMLAFTHDWCSSHPSVVERKYKDLRRGCVDRLLWKLEKFCTNVMDRVQHFW